MAGLHGCKIVTSWREKNEKKIIYVRNATAFILDKKNASIHSFKMRVVVTTVYIHKM